MKGSIKKGISRYVKKHPFLRTKWRDVLFVKRRICYMWRKRNIIPDEKTVVFDSFKGKIWGCNPKAVYEYMLSQERFDDWKFVLLFKNPEKYSYLEKNPNTRVVKQTGRNYERELAGAKYWIMSFRVPDYIYPGKSQVFVQCWHGTPLKRLGYDLVTFENAVDTVEDVRRKYDLDSEKFTYLLSPSPYATEKFSSAWNLNAKKMTDKILEIGYPRNDFLSSYTERDVENIKENLGISKDKKVILYAPTWRDNQHEAGVGFTYDLNLNFDKWREALGDEYVVLFRTHYFVANTFSFDKYGGFVINVSDYDDINHLYVISDLLITDYSSVVFDYAVLKRPVLFYMYDLKIYRERIRGFYFDLKELPGEIFTREQELVDAIPGSIENFVYDEKYRKFNMTFNPLDDGQASARFAARIFPEAATGKRSQIQDIIWEIFLNVRDILDKEGITWYIMGGTLLGAVRYEGFIPWDDDIDIGLKRPDYELFLNTVSDMLPAHLKLYTYQNNPDHRYYFARIVDTRYQVRRTGSLKVRDENVWVDIFPLDGMPDNPVLRGVHMVRLLYARVRYHMANFDRINLERPDRPFAQRAVIAAVKKFRPKPSGNYLVYLNKVDLLLKKYPPKSCRRIVNFMGQYCFKEMFLQKYYGKGKKYLFENTEVTGPEDSGHILKQMYGDYMKQPDERYRNVHAAVLKSDKND